MDKYILPNRIGFSYNTYKKFNPDKYKEKVCKIEDEKCDDIKLFQHQKVVRDYLQFDSPYRGLLLYHELGSGKSAASIASAEGFIEKKKIYVLTPASLATNYENEILKISKIGLNLKKDWFLVLINPKKKETYKILLEKYGISSTIIKKSNLVWIPLYENDLPDGKIEKTKIEKDDKLLIDNMISHIIKNRYKFISYNGLTQKIITETNKEGFDNSFIIIDEIHNFISRIVNGSKLARALYNNMMTAIDCKIVLLSGTPIINNPYEIASLINLIRGPMIIYELNLLKTSIVPQIHLIKNKLENSEILSYIDEYNVDIDKRIITISLLPIGYKKEENDYLKIKKEKWGKTIKVIMDDIIKLLNEINNVKISVKYNSNNYYALPNKKEDFNDIFIDDLDPENPKIINNDLFMRRILGTVSYYKITGTELFPTVLPQNIRYIDMTNHQLSAYSNVRMIERNMDNAKKQKGGIMDDKTAVYRAFSRMVCNFVFPDNIKRLYPHDIKKALKREIDVDENENDNEEEVIKEDKPKKKDDEYEIQLKEAMNKLIESDSLTRENLDKLYSPKFSSMLKDVEESPGSVLIYSQFRVVEGLGIFSEILNKNGYKEIELKKVENNYVFTDIDIFDEKYDNKRYVIFNQDKVKTNILMNLFNGAYDLLPSSINDNLPTNKEQLYGKLVKIFMITASGAEGISLKNVRRVLITEPYWNNVRISQVIGRAIRTRSHIQLPKEDRNVQVFMYIMKLTKEQLDMDFTLKTLDKGKTTDEHIQEVALKKEFIINGFLNMLKSSSFDCIINSKENKPLENDVKCYNWAIGVNNTEFSYTNDYKDDYKIMSHKRYQIKKKNKGIVISYNDKKYVTIDNKIYDYYSYVNSGVLVPIDIKEIK